mgnify:CR=1 FL=1|jgi:predicted nucleotidyltransferase
MKESLQIILDGYKEDVFNILQDRLVKIILYGSHARGDYREDSDIDLLILVNTAQDDLHYYTDAIYDLSYDYDQKYDIEINPVVQSFAIYEHWKTTYPFFLNVEKEGVAV